MSAVRLIEACRTAGLSLAVEGDYLCVEFDRDPPAELLDEIRRSKAEIVAALLRLDLLPTDWRDLYEERAAIREYDGRYTRAEAEALAWGQLQIRWHAQNGERVPRDLCAGCRRSIGAAEALDMIDGCRVHFENSDCLIQHGERWRTAVTEALMALGLRPPPARGRPSNAP